ncbi:hypothetical protein [Pseudonocardia sp. McavD-2-B]|uniref:hypothetical protein n=1 Tax=Pseudonocardia sp. McavD-2-B TaxID=2954499 RepID=UPI0020970195|nr:hypothetical protein [Pseudonocardia sp. McavD-2-B]MCO7193955.1 hypothetical protein [Pseudonocardia sp. McavD-2-B]
MTTDTRTVADLEAALLDGENITADQLAAARAHDDHRQLVEAAAKKTAQAAAEQHRQAALAQLRADVAATANATAEIQAAAQQAIDAVARYATLIGRHSDDVADLVRRARAAGAPQHDPGQALDDNGIAWRLALGGWTGAGIRLALDDDGERRIAQPDRDQLVARLLGAAANTVQLSRRVDIPRGSTTDELTAKIESLDHTIRRPEQAVVILHSGSRRGHRATVTVAEAQHMIERGTARWPDTAS